MSVLNFPASHRQQPLKLSCTRCGVTVDAGCDCGVDYVPAKQRVAEYDKENPGRSTRQAAADLGVSNKTVSEARAGVTQVTPATVTGRDGKNYPARRAKSNPAKPAAKPASPPAGTVEISIKEAKERYEPAHKRVENGQPDGQDNARETVNPTIAALNALVAARNAATPAQRAEFEKYVTEHENDRRLVKRLAALSDPTKTLTPALVTKAIDLLPVATFKQGYFDAKRLQARLDEADADEKLRTHTFTRSTLIRGNGASRMSPEAIRLAADRAERRASQVTAAVHS